MITIPKDSLLPFVQTFRMITRLSFLVLAFAAPAVAGSLELVNDPATGGPGKFAAEEIRREAGARGMTLGNDANATRIALTVEKEGKAAAQSYSIRVQNDGGRRVITVRGTDAVGAMYGGLDVAEAIRTGTLDSLKDSDHTPHIAQRGIKFNIPLDLRTPSYSDPADAAQANIPEMWSMDFWRALLDDMARHRYNVLSLWNLHPFPSLVKVPEFPHVALNDVWRTTARLDEKFSGSGKGFVRPEMLAHHEVVRKLSIAEKIQFWRDVMQLAKDRGVDVYWFTWNTFLYGAEGQDGLTGNKTALRTIEYFRASVRETITTYPLLAGLGLTAGEAMEAKEFKDISKEQWLWQTYGEGIRDALKAEPQRKFRLIHRFHQTGLSEIQGAFTELPCPLDLSFKYAVAHMYSVPEPAMIKPVLPLLSPALRCWLTVRNDDIYSFRWADYDFARAFIKGIPGPDKIAGFYMGPDGYIWGREYLAKEAAAPRQTVMQKQWLSFTLWGRLAYEPDLPADTFQRLTAAHFPGADVPALTTAWADASKTFPYITRFFWGDIDVKWFPEACRRKSGFYTVRDFVEGGTMPGAGVLNIVEWRTGLLAKQQPTCVTPLEIAATLDANATKALRALPELQRATVTPAASAKEYAATLGDIEAMAHLGLYYAAKIRGACDLALYDKSSDAARQASAVQHLEAALRHWKNYAAAYTRQYVQPVLYNRAGMVDIPRQTENVAADVQMARDWKPGTVEERNNKRVRTAGAISALSLAATPGTKIKLSLATYQWCMNWDIPTMIANLQKANVLSVELRTQSKYKHGVELDLNAAQRAEVKKQFADSPVAVVAIACSERMDWFAPVKLQIAIADAKQYLQLCYDIGASSLRIFPNQFHKQVPKEETIEQIARAVKELGVFAESIGQYVDLEVSGPAGELSTMKAVMDQVTAKAVGVRLNCDKRDTTGVGLEANFNLVEDRLA